MTPLYVGVISGTSVDGLDIALLEEGDPPTLLHAATVPFDTGLGERLKALFAPGEDGVENVGRADALLGDFIGRSVLTFLEANAVDVARVRAIGSHGQTIRHIPGEFTVQIGDPNRIAEITGIDCIADFRRRDMAAGGEAAPLVPPFHAALFRTAVDRVVLNIGGISNITVLAADPAVPVTGFDTGPGNALLDAWSEHERALPYDEDGRWAASGVVNDALMGALRNDPYVAATPPKSTGKERYNLDYVTTALAAVGAVDAADVQATLADFTAWSVAHGVRSWGPAAGDLIVCGGGRLNGHVMARLQHHLPTFAVRATEALGVDGDAVEAGLFAWLAAQYVNGRAGNEPAVTGAAGARVLGGLYPGAG